MSATGVSCTRVTVGEDMRTKLIRVPSRRAAAVGAALAVPLAAVAVVLAGGSSQAGHLSAEATLRTADGTKVGWTTFTVTRDKTYVRVWLNLRRTPGLTALDAFHGFHIHANDVPANGAGCLADPAQPPATWFVSADGHLTEPGRTHGAHTGDMPPLLVNADGEADLKFTTGRLTLSQLSKRAVVFHAGPDNLGHVPVGTATDAYSPNSPAATAKTAATGNAGDRVACGVIKVRR
jgi:Cu-Zn family superoxide dismutase